MMHLRSQQWVIDNIGLHDMPDTLVLHGTAYRSLRRAKRHVYDENTLWTLSVLTFQPNNQLAKVANVLWLGDALVASVVRLLSVAFFLVQIILFSWYINKLSMIQAKSDRITEELINIVWQKQGDFRQRNTNMPDTGDRIWEDFSGK